MSSDIKTAADRIVEKVSIHANGFVNSKLHEYSTLRLAIIVASEVVYSPDIDANSKNKYNQILTELKSRIV